MGPDRPSPRPQALDPDTRTRMEAAFGHSFTDVRIHADDHAASATRALDAWAFTRGTDVFFAHGRYAPRTTTGLRLLAHELAHVVQQRMAHGAPQAPPATDRARLEGEADRAGTAVAAGHRSSRLSPAVGAGVQRQARPADQPLESVAGISTPLERGSRRRPGGGRTLVVGEVTVVVLPDQDSDDVNLRGRAETTISFSDYNIQGRTRGDQVVSFTGPGAVVATIQTTYGQGVTRATPSGYGRGTTAADQAAAATSLGFHEGRHGRDFVEFLRSHPYPRFAGRRGMATDAFQAAEEAYATARDQYQRDIDAFTAQRTDCVGTTIDEYKRRQGVASAICRRVE